MLATSNDRMDDSPDDQIAARNMWKKVRIESRDVARREANASDAFRPRTKRAIARTS
jgi:hypothetical protein